jgi:type II secretory pathway pseudopilin PulG
MTGRRNKADKRDLPGLKSFSIVELLVALAILSILIVLLLGMLSSLITTWQQGEAHNERRTVGQAVLDRMSRDLSQTALPLSPTNTNSLEMVINPSSVSSSYEYPQSIFFQAPVATDGGTNGDLAVVGYFVQWVAETSGAPLTPCLSRVLINPSSSDYAVYSGTPSTWISSALLAKYAPATGAGNYQGILAENVIGLWVQALDPTGTNAIQQTVSPALKGEAFDSRYPYAYTNYDRNGGNGYLTTNAASALPASLQIAIAVVDSRTAKQFASVGQPTYYAPTGNFWGDIRNFYTNLPSVIQKGTEIQTTTVPLMNGPR